MASPFSVFRRHQRVLIGALTLLAMFAFVFLEPLLDAFQGDPQNNPVVASTRDYGDLRQDDVLNLRYQRVLVLNVLEQVLTRGGVHPTIAGFQVQQLFGPPTHEAVVTGWLFAQRAEGLGMVVDDRAVTEFLSEFLEQATEGRVRIGEVAEILRREGTPQRVLFAALRRELLARQLYQSFQTSLLAVPPMQRWDYYLRLNRRATVELAPVPVVDFMDRIESPGESVLRVFFDEHKERTWRPDRPEPAFRQPQRIALQYLKAELDDFVDPDAVTEDEVLAYYEENKDTLFKQPRTPVPEEVQPSDTGPEAEPSEEAPAQQEAEPSEEATVEPEAEPSEEPTVEPEAEPSEEAPVEPEAESSEEATVEPEAEPSEEATVEPEDEPSEEPTVEPEQSDDAAPPSSEDGAAWRSVPAASRFQFTSFVDQEADEDDDPPDEEPAAEDDDPPGGEPAAETAEPSLEAPSPELPEESVPADDEPASPERSQLDGEPEEPVAHRPLSEVEDEIRRTLARRKAHEEIEQLLRSLSARMQRYHDELTVYEVKREEDPSVAPPAELDMKELASEHGLKSFETDLISQWEARTLDIGESLVEGSHPFVRYVFEELPLFQSAISQAEEDYFLFWKTEEREERIPDWDDEDVKEQVLEAWKLVEARSLARAHAEELAERARDSGKTLEAFFADNSKHEVVQAGPFSWMTYGDIPPMLAREPPRISEVEGVDFTGHRFMREVFALEEGELGVTMNQPQTFAYVVRMVSLVPSQTVLWEGFLADRFDKYEAAAIPNLRQMQAAWQQEVEEAAGFQWVYRFWTQRASM